MTWLNLFCDPFGRGEAEQMTETCPHCGIVAVYEAVRTDPPSWRCICGACDCAAVASRDQLSDADQRDED